MNLSKLLEFSNEEHAHISKKYGFSNKGDAIYPMMLKLTEEVGELSEAILHFKSLQRKSKLDNPNDIGGELADVILTAINLSIAFEMDITEELKKKIQRIKSRRDD